MFERFTKAARAVVIDAQGQARRLEHCAVGTEHLLLALLAQDGPSAMLLRDAGVTTDKANATIRRVLGAAPLGADDAAALRAIGIDLDEVRARIEENFGPVDLTPPPTPARHRSGHIPFSRRAKKVLELSLREAVRLSHRYIGSEHILLGLLREGEGLAALILTEAGVDFVDLRQKIETSLRAAA